MAHHLPVRPAPHCTSSTTSRMPCRSQMRRISRGSCRRDDVAAFALDGLDEDGRDFFRRQDGLEELLFDVARAAQAEGFLLLGAAGAATIGVGIADVRDAGNQRREAAFLLGLGGGERERAHGAAVEGAEEGDDVLAAGVIAGQLERALDGLGAGVAVEELVRAGHGRDGREPLGEVVSMLS